LRVQMEINEIENKLTLLEENRTPLIARFNQLLNRPSGEPVNLSDSLEAAHLPLPVAAIPDSIRSNNPMLKMLGQQEAAYTAQGTMGQKMGMPMIGVGLQYEIFKPRHPATSSMNGRNMLMPMATVTIPLWRKKYSAAVREAELMNQSVIADKQDITRQLMVNYEEVLRDFHDARRRTLLYQQQTSLANNALNILMVQYTTEEIRFEEVLRMQQQLLRYRLNHLDALIDGHIAAAMIERLMGR
jgi:outer membrane protein TolC